MSLRQKRWRLEVVEGEVMIRHTFVADLDDHGFFWILWISLEDEYDDPLRRCVFNCVLEEIVQ